LEYFLFGLTYVVYQQFGFMCAFLFFGSLVAFQLYVLSVMWDEPINRDR